MASPSAPGSAANSLTITEEDGSGYDEAGARISFLIGTVLL
jgi:hypothetical protein